jgi:hypothetical protein
LNCRHPGYWSLQPRTTSKISYVILLILPFKTSLWLKLLEQVHTLLCACSPIAMLVYSHRKLISRESLSDCCLVW